MAQVKKPEVQKSILEAAFTLFSEQGYQSTSMPDIASRAGITAGNIYRYYKSKFELFYDVLEPWLNDQLDCLEQEVAELADEREMLRKVLKFMWVDLPRAENNFELNLMEALATKKPDETYSRDLLLSSEKRITGLLEAILPIHVKETFPSNDISHLMFMCHDGFVLNTKLVNNTARDQVLIDRFVTLAFGSVQRSGHSNG